jgi:hypothetical protein
MNEKLTEKVKGCLRRMEAMLDWQLGPLFKYFSGLAERELHTLKVVEYPTYNPSQFDYFQMRYDQMVERARATELI